MCFSTWRLVGISKWVDFEARQGGVRGLDVLWEKKSKVSDVDAWNGPQGLRKFKFSVENLWQVAWNEKLLI